MYEKGLQIVKAFVEGNLDVKDFKTIFFEDEELQKIISKINPSMMDKYNGTLNFMLCMNWNNPIQVDEMHIVMKILLMHFHIDYNETAKYEKAASVYYSLIPSWIGEEENDYVIEAIIEKAPKGLTKTETKAWIKTKIRETFKYEKRPPQWVQEGNWPRDEEGNFLTFRSQKEDGDLVTYTFVNPKTGEEVQTQEFY